MTAGRRPRRVRPLASLIALGVAACSSETTIVQPPVEIVIGSGDGQFGVVGQELGSPLRVVVQSISTGLPRESVSVLWDVTEGGAVLLGVTTTVTDSTGSTEIRVRLGSAPGEVTVRARVAEQMSATTTFTLFGVNSPTLAQVSPTAAAAGDTVTLTGTDFSPVPEQDVVLFSGVRGRVVAATSTTLRVEVPLCLPARAVDVSVQLGVVASAQSRPLTVTGGGTLSTLQVGDVVDVTDPAGYPCHALPGGVGVAYLAVVHSASTVGAARHPFELTALSSALPTAAPARAEIADGRARTRADDSDPQALWDERLRALEGELIRARRAADGSGPAPVAPAGVPALGERRTFNVLNAENGFDQVTAVAQWIGSEAAIFVDETAPAGGFTQAELAQFAARFDQVIHPVVSLTFGSASDLDANDRIVILFTPAVNRLTPRATSGFIGGFFYGIDLIPTTAGSNNGEIFYALVPDSTGVHSSRRTKVQVASVVPAILAHEFDHMVHFNERILIRKAAGQEALWLSEALAQMAEEIVARAYQGLGDAASDSLFRSGTRARARRYLQKPDTVSLIVTTGGGSLPERGAGFLHLLYVEDQVGGDILRRLTQTTRTGVANLEVEMGTSWPDLVSDWWSALYLDRPGPGTGPLTYPTVDLRGWLGTPYPLAPAAAGPGDFTASGSLWSSSAAYYIVTPGSGGSATVRLGGEAGGPSAPQAALRLRIIRLS